MAPTLQDVSYLLGLPLAGVPIGPVDAPENWAQEMAQRFYGIREGVPEFTYENHGPKFDWLQNYQVRLLLSIFVFDTPIFISHDAKTCPLNQCSYRGSGTQMF